MREFGEPQQIAFPFNSIHFREMHEQFILLWPCEKTFFVHHRSEKKMNRKWIENELKMKKRKEDKTKGKWKENHVTRGWSIVFDNQFVNERSKECHWCISKWCAQVLKHEWKKSSKSMSMANLRSIKRRQKLNGMEMRVNEMKFDEQNFGQMMVADGVQRRNSNGRNKNMSQHERTWANSRA